MVNQILLEEIQSILGKGIKTARGNYKFNCFKIHKNGLHDTTHKLEICLDPTLPHYQHSHCWSCDLRSKKLISLIKPLNINPDKIQQLKLILSDENTNDSNIQNISINSISLPTEYISLIKDSNSVLRKHAMFFLKNRNITENDIIKYNIGYCEEGKYKNRIIIPSYDNMGELNYFIARSFNDENERYKNPQISRNIIPFEFFINWNLPIIIVEGAFDMIALKRNTIPLLGKNIQDGLMKKIIQSNVNRIYICLDKELIKKSLKYCEELINEGKKVYLVELNEKDPSQIGFLKMTNILQTTTSLTFSKLLEKKFQYG